MKRGRPNRVSVHAPIIHNPGAYCQDPFSEIREKISLREAVVFYGYSPNRAGFLCCPFHHEKTPSLKIYQTSWYCFGCKTGGSVIDFTARLFDLKPLEAAQKLDADFHLNLFAERKPPTRAALRAQEKREQDKAIIQAFQSWREQTLDHLSECLYIAEHISDWNAMTPQQIEAVKWREWMDDMWYSLFYGSVETQIEIFKHHKKGIGRICGKIIQPC